MASSASVSIPSARLVAPGPPGQARVAVGDGLEQLVVGDAVDDGRVDLDDVGPELQEVLHADVSGTGVVEGDPHPEERRWSMAPVKRR